ncbi:MAG TPA: radical SAM protein, partial [Candidatus Polarisedimenticolia bacterium]|nr:radical SAM protein [Candidatus Polarisedimenticolia bacterium]
MSQSLHSAEESGLLHRLRRREPVARSPAFLLIGPYDPECGEYTFLAPPLGVWRLAGVLESAGYDVEVFDPNCCEGPPERALEQALRRRKRDVVGVSTTFMTLPFDLSLATLARRVAPQALLIAGGMEATFNSRSVLDLGPFDLAVLGEGEIPLLELGERLARGASLSGVPGTVHRAADGTPVRLAHRAMTREELRDAIFATPYERMPYRAYWDRLARAYEVGELPTKAERETRLAEIRSVRLITLNYCPMACTFCSSTNFLHSAQGGTARLARLSAEECLAMLRRILSAHPEARTLIFQDDIFAFRNDERLLPLCRALEEGKRTGEIPEHLGFISTNRIDAMNDERLAAMRRAGFRVLGFGIENFSLAVLKEF